MLWSFVRLEKLKKGEYLHKTNYSNNFHESHVEFCFTITLHAEEIDSKD